jgi:hypothetical protein
MKEQMPRMSKSDRSGCKPIANKLTIELETAAAPSCRARLLRFRKILRSLCGKRPTKSKIKMAACRYRIHTTTKYLAAAMPPHRVYRFPIKTQPLPTIANHLVRVPIASQTSRVSASNAYSLLAYCERQQCSRNQRKHGPHSDFDPRRELRCRPRHEIKARVLGATARSIADSRRANGEINAQGQDISCALP